ncbi:urokinase plasminogen activator surface receptor isoform X1 [Pogona vitticeps]
MWRMGQNGKSADIVRLCLSPANSLRCAKCVSKKGNCNETEVEACSSYQDACFFEVKDFIGVSGTTVKRGCTTANYCRRYPGGYKGHLDRIMYCCSSDLCEPVDYHHSHTGAENGMVCQSCIGNEAECGQNAWSEPCRGNADRCIQISQRFLPGEELEPIIKGCGDSSFRDTLVAYQIGKDFAYVEQNVCGLRNCNNRSFPDISPGQPNGLKCYTCRETGKGECDRERLQLLNCTGIMDRCVHIISKDRDVPTTIQKGCATESMCTSYSDIYYKLMRQDSYPACCKKSFCNRAGDHSGPEMLLAVAGVVLWLAMMAGK